MCVFSCTILAGPISQQVNDWDISQNPDVGLSLRNHPYSSDDSVEASPLTFDESSQPELPDCVSEGFSDDYSDSLADNLRGESEIDGNLYRNLVRRKTEACKPTGYMITPKPQRERQIKIDLPQGNRRFRIKLQDQPATPLAQLRNGLKTGSCKKVGCAGAEVAATPYMIPWVLNCALGKLFLRTFDP